MNLPDQIGRRWRGESGALPLPGGERAGVRGFEPIERPYPLPPPLSPWEREPSQCAARLRFILRVLRSNERPCQRGFRLREWARLCISARLGDDDGRLVVERGDVVARKGSTRNER